LRKLASGRPIFWLKPQFAGFFVKMQKNICTMVKELVNTVRLNGRPYSSVGRAVDL